MSAALADAVTNHGSAAGGDPSAPKANAVARCAPEVKFCDVPTLVPAREPSESAPFLTLRGKKTAGPGTVLQVRKCVPTVIIGPADGVDILPGIFRAWSFFKQVVDHTMTSRGDFGVLRAKGGTMWILVTAGASPD